MSTHVPILSLLSSKNNTQSGELTQLLACLHLPYTIREHASLLPQLLLQKQSPRNQHFYFRVTGK